jgi:hypothetical protein
VRGHRVPGRASVAAAQPAALPAPEDYGQMIPVSPTLVKDVLFNIGADLAPRPVA